MVPNAQNGNRSRMYRVTHDVIAKHHVPDIGRFSRTLNASAHFRETAKMFNPPDQLTADALGGTGIMGRNEMTQPYQIGDGLPRVNELHPSTLGDASSSVAPHDASQSCTALADATLPQATESIAAIVCRQRSSSHFCRAR